MQPALSDRLAFIRQAPELVERVVRSAAREAIEAKRLSDRALDVRDIANLALGELERALAAANVRLDAVERHELAGSTLRAATAFASSRLARRLRTVPVARFRAAPAGADAALADRDGNVHIIRVEAFAGDAQRVACAREIEATLVAAGSATLRPPAVHFLSLRDGKLRSFAAPRLAGRRGSASHRAA